MDKNSVLFASSMEIYRILCLKASILCLFILVLNGNILIGNNDPVKVPKITCNETVFDFGEKLDTKFLDHTFFIKNDGDAPLIISSVRPSCGCSVISLSDNTIPPGEKAELIAHTSLAGQRGKFQKSIVLQSNDPETAIIFLYIQGTVISEVDVIPHKLLLGDVLSNDNVQVAGDVVVKSQKIKPFKIFGIKTDSAYFTTESHTIKEDEAYRIIIRSAKPLPAGYFLDKIHINTNHPEYSEIIVPIVANVKKQLTIAPEEIVLPDNRDIPVSRYVFVRMGTNRKFQILSATPPGKRPFRC